MGQRSAPPTAAQKSDEQTLKPVERPGGRFLFTDELSCPSRVCRRHEDLHAAAGLELRIKTPRVIRGHRRLDAVAAQHAGDQLGLGAAADDRDGYGGHSTSVRSP